MKRWFISGPSGPNNHDSSNTWRCAKYLNAFGAGLLLLLQIDCSSPRRPSPRWDGARVPTVEFGDGECPEAFARPSLCEWLWSADAVVEATIVRAEAVWEPRRSRSVATVADEPDVDVCAVVIPLVRLTLRDVTRLAGPGALPTDGALVVTVPPLHVEVWTPVVKRYRPGLDAAPAAAVTPLVVEGDGLIFEPGKRILLPLIISGSGITVVDGRQLPDVVDGRLHVPDPLEECAAPFAGDGLGLDALRRAAEGCRDNEVGQTAREQSRREHRLEAPESLDESLSFRALCLKRP